MERNYMKYHRSINYYETDQMGIVHHSNYIRFFEEARLMLMKQSGMDYRGLEEMGIIIPVTFVQCNYLVPLRFEDEVEIATRITKYDGIKMEVSYEIYQERAGQLCTTGKTGHCFLDRELKPIRMKRKYPDLFSKLKAMVEE
ncbi:MAG: acyl-CoA thioesterase [Lachnospiraceae bacterium]|jgi:acyl-CoA thioester hydrolase|nr:acyl-CoA thioesterase [Lachnospiraceae bacterium]